MKKSRIISILSVALIVALIVGANVWRSHSVVRDVRVDIDYQGADTLIPQEQVKEMIVAAMPHLYTTRLKQVDLEAVEKAVAASPFFVDCQAGTSIGGAVVLFARQRRPVVRVFTGSTEYYLSDTRHPMPLSPYGSSDVIVAGGTIPLKGKGLDDVWALANYLDRHPDYGVLFDQIYRDSRGDLFLTPKVGSHVVQVGSTDNLDDKFRNLMVFYTRGLPQAGWDTYSQVSVKYRDQVVATRKDNR